jgi:hypothetical protein
MKFLFWFITIFLLVGCIKTQKGEMTERTDSNIENGKTENILQIESKETIPRIEISESIFKEFPDNPDYFNEHNIFITIQKDNENFVGPKYFGNSPIFIKGDKFDIIYSTDDKYKIEKVVLYGTTIFSIWNVLFDADINDIISSWGEPTYNLADGYLFYDSEQYWISVLFTYKNNKVIKIEIARDP